MYTIPKEEIQWSLTKIQTADLAFCNYTTKMGQVLADNQVKYMELMRQDIASYVAAMGSRLVYKYIAEQDRRLISCSNKHQQKTKSSASGICKLNHTQLANVGTVIFWCLSGFCGGNVKSLSSHFNFLQGDPRFPITKRILNSSSLVSLILCLPGVNR